MRFPRFTAASLVFDLMTSIIGYERCFSARYSPILIALTGVTSTWVAGLIIGAFFMGGKVSLLYFSALHAAGGLSGSILGLAVIKAVEGRSVNPAAA